MKMFGKMQQTDEGHPVTALSLRPRSLRPQRVLAIPKAPHSGRSVRTPVQLDQLDLVAVRILDERDRRATVLHRSRLARDLHTCRAQLLDLRVDPVHAEREVAEPRADVVP